MEIKTTKQLDINLKDLTQLRKIIDEGITLEELEQGKITNPYLALVAGMQDPITYAYIDENMFSIAEWLEIVKEDHIVASYITAKTRFAVCELYLDSLLGIKKEEEPKESKEEIMDWESCVDCRYDELDPDDYPCINCKHSHFLPNDYANKFRPKEIKTKTNRIFKKE